MEILRSEFTPNDELSEMQMEVKFKALEDLTIEQVESATWQIIKTRKTATFPKVGEIRSTVTGDADEIAVLAYDAFRKGKGQTGIYNSVVFDDRIIHATVDAMGGWQQVCLITEDDWQFRRREFLDTYKAFLQHQPREIPEKLIGLIEQDNHNRGFSERIPEPKFIGKEKQLPRIEHNAEVIT
jgi:hypothetical protein